MSGFSIKIIIIVIITIDKYDIKSYYYTIKETHDN